MNDRGNRYALFALKDKRATISAEIVQLQRQLRHRKELLGHVDITLRLLDPSVEVEAIPNKRLPRRVKLFRQGEHIPPVRVCTYRSTRGSAWSAGKLFGLTSGNGLSVAPRRTRPSS